jgi:hypothetical protein
MHRRRLFRNGKFFPFLLLFFITIITVPATRCTGAEQPSATQGKQPERNDLVYTLHHQIIPGILFSDKGTLFFNDLFTGKTGQFVKIVEEPLGKAYASGMKFKAEHRPDFDIVLISFPEPLAEPQNYHAALVRTNGAFRYITLEKGNDIGNTGMKTFLCEWSAEYNHKNYGPRKYTDLASFRNELPDFLKK